MTGFYCCFVLLFFFLFNGWAFQCFLLASDFSIETWSFLFFMPTFIQVIRFGFISIFFRMESPEYLYVKFKELNIKEILIKNYLVFYHKEQAELISNYFIHQKKEL